MADIIDRIMHRAGAARSTNGEAVSKPTAMTVRMPKALYDELKREAHERGVSANRLAVAKLSIKGNILDRVAAAIALSERCGQQRENLPAFTVPDTFGGRELAPAQGNGEHISTS